MSHFTIGPSIRNDRVEVFNDSKKPLGFFPVVNAQVNDFLGEFSSKHTLIIPLNVKLALLDVVF